MDKFQETLKKQIEYAEFTENSVVCLDIEVAKGLLNTQTESPTLEEVKKEWKALGYKWIENKDSIDLLNESKEEIIVIDKENKRFAKTDDRVKIPLFINWQEHQLLTKTFKVLGWL